MRNLVIGIDRFLFRLESLFLTTFLLTLVGFGVIQIILRRFTDSAIPDLEIGLRWLVVWLTFAGASLATREHKHINVDALGRLFRGKARRWLQLFINCFSLFIVILLMLAARDFVLMEREFATEISHGVPAWIVELILPFGFLLIAIRLVLDSILLFAPQKEADNNA